MRTLQPYWVDQDNWACPRHLPSPRIPASVSECWYGCKTARPEDRPSPVKVEILKPLAEPNGLVCSWDECDQSARGKSKYCSRNCSNKNARARHKARKAA